MLRLHKLIACLLVSEYRRALLVGGVAAGIEHIEVLKSVNCATVVDIGANKGQFALAVCHNLSNAKVISFEPLSKPANIFSRVFKNNNNVTLFEVAIGAHNGNEVIHVSRREDSSSILPIGKNQNSIFPGTEEVSTKTIEVGKLSKYVKKDAILHPAMLKIDVQGFELSVLKGGETIIDLFEWVYVECSFVELYEGQALAGEIITWLSDRGFQLSSVHNPTTHKDGSIVQADFLFTNKQSVK